jgi:hypothetical protein
MTSRWYSSVGKASPPYAPKQGGTPGLTLRSKAGRLAYAPIPVTDLDALACALAAAGYGLFVRVARWTGWIGLLIIATFCWVVLIEHGPANFVEGVQIELENLVSIAMRHA